MLWQAALLEVARRETTTEEVICDVPSEYLSLEGWASTSQPSFAEMMKTLCRKLNINAMLGSLRRKTAK